MIPPNVRRRRLTVTVAAAIVAVAWSGAVGNAIGAGDPVRLSARTGYVVREGDTLWSIAERMAPGEDPRPLVDAISAANRLEAASIVPGQTLIVPARS